MDGPDAAQRVYAMRRTMADSVQGRTLRLLVTLVALAPSLVVACGGGAGNADVAAQGGQRGDEGTQAAPETMPQIIDVVAAQIYWGFGYGLPDKQSKFVVLFDKMFGEAGTSNIARMYAEGPDGYRFEIDNQAFTNQNGNGYIEEAAYNNYRWFMAFDRSGFLKDGEYTVVVEYKNGEKSQMSRTLQYDDSILASYLADRDKIVFSPTNAGSPEAQSPAVNASESPLEVKWTTLAGLGGPDAYYCLRIAEDKGSAWDNANMTVFDNIFDASKVAPDAGLNKASFSVGGGILKPGSKYLWFTEICDSNHYRDINICIFQPFQAFTTG
jgi:hypothetical protein